MNLLDAMVDTAISALKRLGYPNMPVVITETGWPNGGSTRNGVNVQSAGT
jgi:exo-beta-1,3-glucanase (GH17 family)